MGIDFKNNEMIRAVVLAYEKKSAGMGALFKKIGVAKREGRIEDWHVLADSYVTAAKYFRTRLVSAEKIARDLVAFQPDKHHLQKLASILELRGKKRSARLLQSRAVNTRDEHLTPEIEAALR